MSECFYLAFGSIVAVLLIIIVILTIIIIRHRRDNKSELSFLSSYDKHVTPLFP